MKSKMNKTWGAEVRKYKTCEVELMSMDYKHQNKRKALVHTNI